MDASQRFAGDLIARRAAVIAQDELVGRQGDRLTDGGRGDSLGQGARRSPGRLFGGRGEEGLAELLHPGVVGPAVPRLALKQVVFLQHPRQEGPWIITARGRGPGLRLHAIPDGLAEKREGLFPADDLQEIPGAIGQHDPMNLGVVVNGMKQLVEGVLGRSLSEGSQGLFSGGGLPAADLGAHPLPAIRSFREIGRGNGVEDLAGTPAILWMRFVLR